ncbi:UNVERIFIED_CONTAM: hypothetical protein FKN15_043220 [Acipenser sinensis]
MTSSALTSDPLGGLLDSLLWGSPSFLTAEPEGGGAGGLLLSGSGGSDDDDDMFQSHLKEFGSPSSSPLSPSSFFSSSSSSFPSSSPLLQCPLGKAVEPLDWLLDPMADDCTAKPYSRPTREEQEVCVSLSGHVKSADKRKMKKMEQNKTAATRYRQKKRSELDRLRGEREALEEKNRALGERAEAIATEIRYLTELMREVREARGRRLQQGKGSE